MSPSACSAPGKCLLAGGYLVTDRQYRGLVFGLDARMHAIVKAAEISHPPRITVKSPQFKDAVWRYDVIPEEGRMLVEERGSVETKSNLFVSTTLYYCLNYLLAKDPAFEPIPFEITILAERSYYSSSQITQGSQPSHAKFSTYALTRISEVKKTGLGSSAALVSSIVGAVLAFYDAPRQGLPAFRRKTHNLAQIAHIAAQGKIGSGFDVASAAYGSCIYRTFDKQPLNVLNKPVVISLSTIRDLVDGLIDGSSLLNCEIQPLGRGIPEGHRLVICDVEAGSETVGMVRAVNAWRTKNRVDSSYLWSKLKDQNERIIQLLLNPPTTTGEAQEDDGNEAVQWRTEVSTTFNTMRGCLRQMGDAAGVPIEPASQTSILDECMSVDGILGACVPGAGGNDALAVIIEDQPKVYEALRQKLTNISSQSTSQVRILDVEVSYDGLRLEDAGMEQYENYLVSSD